MQQSSRFNRLRRLVGNDGFDRLSDSRVIIFGIGGVGGWTAEALGRSGVGRITLVDPDVVALSNVNRQIVALDSTAGLPKVDIMRRRLLDINPGASVTAIQSSYCPDTAASFHLADYDVVIDAIDSLSDKALLILNATAARASLFSSMGAALKMDPTRLRVAEFWDVKGCPLAAALRNRFKRSGNFPKRKFKCVFSPELLKNHDVDPDLSGAMSFNKAVINGASVTVTAPAGFMLASLAINHILAAK